MNRRVGINGTRPEVTIRAGRQTGSQVVREAREFLISTNRPETPRHVTGSEKWKNYYDSGDHVTRIDKRE